jgi:hypothetical protein
MELIEYDEYDFKLIDALKAAIEALVVDKGRLDCRSHIVKIDEVTRVEITRLSKELKKHIMLSGTEFEINVDGEVGVMQKVENGSRGRVIEFWVHPAKAKFNPEKEKFTITDISQFLALGFVQ